MCRTDHGVRHLGVADQVDETPAHAIAAKGTGAGEGSHTLSRALSNGFPLLAQGKSSR